MTSKKLRLNTHFPKLSGNFPISQKRFKAKDLDQLDINKPWVMRCCHKIESIRAEIHGC
ncbi:unnamed protein product [Moneuplotes crassus]|uniref:Uncharacterized protein n=1 Tax=Euplotes crassus TaxID=5936 RepID=A0AAD2D287_EUPCR|nr:unnamed protein product [Moneuplotes crassus]